MRTVDPAILAAQSAPSVMPSVRAVCQREMLSFDSLNILASSWPALGKKLYGAPETYCWAGNNKLFATYRVNTTPSALVKLVDVDAPNLDPTGAASVASVAMRQGLLTLGQNSYLYSAWVGQDNLFQLQRRIVAQTGGALVLGNAANFGPVFGQAFTANSELLVRVEAICPVDDGSGDGPCFAIVGIHNFNLQISTLLFYWVTPTGATQLNAMHQMPLQENYTLWHLAAPHAAFCSATYHSYHKRACLYFNTRQEGGAAMIGILPASMAEHAQTQIVPRYNDDSSISFLPSSVTQINGLMYLSGTVTRRIQSDAGDRILSYEAYLLSLDGVRFSFGESSHFVRQYAQRGTLIVPPASSSLYGCIYSIGRGIVARAAATQIQLPGAPAPALQAVELAVLDWEAKFVTNDPDTLTLGVAIRQDAPEVDSIIRTGSIIYLWAGYYDTNTPIGVYSIDRVENAVSDDGREALKITCRDLLSKKLTDWHAPMDTELTSRKAISTYLNDERELSFFTPKRDVTLGEKGLTFSGLNNPMVAWLDTHDTGNALGKATVRFDVDATHHLSVFGFALGGHEFEISDFTGELHKSADFLMALFPKEMDWPGHNHSSPLLRSARFGNSTGADIEEHMHSLVEGVNAGYVRSTDAEAEVLHEETWQARPKYTYDVAVRTHGRRVQIFARIRKLSKFNAAAHAEYRLVSEFSLDGKTRRLPQGTARVGLVCATDVFVSKDVFPNAFYDDVVASVTEAGVQDDPQSGSFHTPITGLITEFNTGPGTNGNDVSGTNTKFLDELRVGQQVFTGSRVRTISAIGSQTGLQMGDSLGGSGTPHQAFIRSSDFHAYASSRQKTKNVNGSLVVDDPGATLSYIELAGFGVFITDDDTALTQRLVVSNGVKHYLANAGWDPTNPIAEPAPWRFIFSHGRVAIGTASAFGLPSHGYLKIDDEIAFYKEIQFLQYKENLSSASYQSLGTWLVIPAYYAVPTTQTAKISRIALGLGLSEFTESVAPGWHIQISSRNSNDSGYYAKRSRSVSPQKRLQLYVYSKTETGLIIGRYAKPFGSLIEEPPDVLLSDKDVLIFDTRGMFGTEKVAHDSDEPVLYYPCDAAGNGPAINVQHVDWFSGTYQSCDDAIQNVCLLAGARRPQTASGFTSPNQWKAVSIQPQTLTQLPLQSVMANFKLKLKTSLPGNSTGSSPYLKVRFRGYYELYLQQRNNLASVSAGRLGNIFVGLATLDPNVTPDAEGIRWLETVVVPQTNVSVSGPITGGSEFTCDNKPKNRVNISIIVQNNLISVEIENVPIWTFNIETMYDESTGDNYARYNANLVYVQIDTPNAVTTARVQQLHDEIEKLVIQTDTSAANALTDLMRSRHIKSRQLFTTKPIMQFSNFSVREDVGQIGPNQWDESFRDDDDSVAAHVRVANENSGEYLDEQWAIKNGYKFATSQNDFAKTNEASAREAKLVVREAQESVSQRDVTGVALVHVQPEDSIWQSYEAGGDLPRHANTHHVVSSATFRDDGEELTGQYEIRKFVS